MKTSMIWVIIVMIVGVIWLFPKKSEEVYIEHGKEQLDLIRVDIVGDVEFPGVYHFFEEISVSEALSYAGKISVDADLSTINLSEMITRDRQIIILSKTDEKIEITQKININQASFKELITISGMTETRAASLIIYRETHGDFKHLDELLNVKHIGVATFEKIKPYLTL